MDQLLKNNPLPWLLEEDPENPGVRLRLGASLMQLGRPDEAVPHLEHAIALTEGDERRAQTHAFAWVSLAHARDALGDIGEADESLCDSPLTRSSTGARCPRDGARTRE